MILLGTCKKNSPICLQKSAIINRMVIDLDIAPMFCQGFGLLGLFPLLMRCLKDMTLAKLSIVFKTASYVLLAFSTNTWMVYLGRYPSSASFPCTSSIHITFCMMLHNNIM